MQNYQVTVAKIGVVNVKADSAEEAMKIAVTVPTNDISWCDSWEATDVEEDDESD